ncbi:DoxX family protein [Novosphingobium sp. Gsoil 351]|uniref:DoxX family protein n=1 Tax=Novosphingobium sp. Gsoil 351 TaxID=2675225 RepID=UPI001E61393C|nr:DoxX family protein [Novosphingobium sp. Gsoil 351]
MARTTVRWLLAALYLTAGIFHVARPQPFLGITPHWVPWPVTVILLTGLAELAAVPALLQPWSRPLRRAAGIGLAVYAVCVYPANVNHMLIDLAKPDHGLGLAYHVPRLLAQPDVVWAALWAGEAIDWPFGRRRAQKA